MLLSAAFITTFAAIASAIPVVEIEQSIRDASGSPALAKRAGGTHTKVDLGVEYIDYGCDASIKTTLSEAMDKLCRDNAASCDESVEYTRDVPWSDGAGPEDWTIKVTAEGEYADAETLGYLKDIVLASVTDETWYNEDVHWTRRYWQHDQSGVCPMTRFSSHIKATRWDDQNLESMISLTVSMEADPYSPCDLVGDIGAAASGMHDAVGTFSGPLELVVCALTGESE